VRNIEGDMSFWALVDLPRLPRWSHGRVVLVGDAAHAPLPHQGQGAGQAIEDAYALGALLAKNGLKDYGAAFQAFEHLRKRRTSLVQDYSRVAGRAYKFVGLAATRRDASWPSLLAVKDADAIVGTSTAPIVTRLAATASPAMRARITCIPPSPEGRSPAGRSRQDPHLSLHICGQDK
jgi:flavin-dependent dehydrogenase